MARKNNVLVLMVLLPLSFISTRTFAGTVTGPIQVATSGKGFPNGTLTFSLTQAAVVSGTATIVTSPVNCYTDALGNVVGLPNSLALPVLSAVNGGGTLPPGNYFVRTTWANSSGETAPGPERNFNTTLAGALVVQVPVNPPANATQWKIYISTTTGAETLQATQNAPFSNYSQTTALAAGAALPASNTTTCSLRFNDELQPSYTGYNVTFTTSNGATVPGFPQKWYLSGGSAGTVNVGNGLPLYSGVVVYPQPIITNPAQAATQSINGPLNMNGFRLTDSNINGFVYVDGTTFTTIQQAITAVCAVGGGTVYVPPGTYPQNSSFVICSSLKLVGAGSGQADSIASCATTITTTLSSGDLLPFNAVNDSYLSDMCIKNIGTAGANAAISFTSAQRNVAERFYITGPFAVGVLFKSSSSATASTIWNTVRDYHCSSLAPNGVGTELNSADATSKVINSNTIWNDHCTGGASGKALWMTNTNQAQVINENVINCSECSATGGTGIQIDQGATRGAVFIDVNAEGSTTCFNKAISNTITFIGGNLSSCGPNVMDAQPAFTHFLGTNVGGTVQQWGVTPIGDQYVDGIGINAIPIANGINSPSGWVLATSGTPRWQVQSGALAPNVAAGSSIGTAALPLSDLFVGSAGTNKALDFDTSTLSANRQIKWADSAGTVVETSSGSGQPLQTKHGAAGCATGTAVGAVCSTTITWTNSYADTNYTVIGCTGNSITSGAPLIQGITAKASGSITVQTIALTAAAAQFTNIECSAIHD